MSNSFQAEAEQIAASLQWQAKIVAPLLALGMILTPMVGGFAAPMADVPAATVLSVGMVFGLAGLALSGLLLFDAALFRLMAAETDETAGGERIDRALADMRLKSMPDRTRSLAERREGAYRLVLWQRIAAGLFAATFVGTLWISAGQIS